MRFDPETHTSRLPDGRDVPHVTRILSATRVSTDFEALAKGHPRRAARITQAGQRGTAVHADAHAYDDNDLDLATVDQRVRPYLDAWITFRRHSGLTPFVNERLVFHPQLLYAGILDRIMIARDASRALVDIKTGDPASAAGHLQTAAYAEAWNVEHPDDAVTTRLAVWLRPERPVPYTVIDYSARPEAAFDFPTFAACVTVFREQQRRS